MPKIVVKSIVIVVVAVIALAAMHRKPFEPLPTSSLPAVAIP
jgi:hypothetical protein